MFSKVNLFDNYLNVDLLSTRLLRHDLAAVLKLLFFVFPCLDSNNFAFTKPIDEGIQITPDNTSSCLLALSSKHYCEFEVDVVWKQENMTNRI